MAFSSFSASFASPLRPFRVDESAIEVNSPFTSNSHLRTPEVLQSPTDLSGVDRGPQSFRQKPTYSPSHRANDSVISYLEESRYLGVRDARARVRVRDGVLKQTPCSLRLAAFQWTYARTLTGRWNPSPLHEYYDSLPQTWGTSARIPYSGPTPLFGCSIGLARAINSSSVFGGFPSSSHPTTVYPPKLHVRPK